MSFAIISFEYDGTRNLPNLQRYVTKNIDNADKLKYIYTAYPCNIHFELNLYVKNTEDGTKIFEQILPFFKPDWTASVQLIPEMGITLDIPIIMTGNQIDDQYAGGFLERQYLNYTFTFLMKAWYFGPSYDKKIIKFANTNFYVPVGNATVTEAVSNTDVLGTIQISPGLDANGDPTSNSALTVNQHTIFVDDDFGYIIDVDDIILTESE